MYSKFNGDCLLLNSWWASLIRAKVVVYVTVQNKNKKDYSIQLSFEVNEHFLARESYYLGGKERLHICYIHLIFLDI